jgi:2,5-dihydroxypyridine 5,6-dioxygenase
MEKAGLLVPLFRRQMEHCQVSSDETVALVTDAKSPREFIGACFAAAEDLDADVFEVQVPEYGRNSVGPEISEGQGGTLRLPEGPVAACKHADMVFDFTLEGFIHVPERGEIREAGTRILRVGAREPHYLRRLMPWEPEEAQRVKERVQRHRDLLAEADEMRVTSEYGTDVTMEVEPSTAFDSYGFVDEPGKWDVWGQNMVSNYPSNVEGTIVIAPSDYNVVPFADYVDSAIECVVEDNYIVEINGEGGDAELMRGHLESYDDPDVWATSHFGWGLNPNGTFYNMALHDRKPDESGVSASEGRVWEGNMLWSTGPNVHDDRYAPCHYDIAQKNCSVYLDGEPVVEEGEVVVD